MGILDVPAYSRIAADAQFLGKRGPARFDPTGKSNGAIGSAMDTGQPVTTFASPTAPSPLIVSSGLITHTPYAGANSAGYMQVDLGARVRRIGCRAAWPTSALGVVALVIPSAAWSSGVLPNAGFHLAINGNGVWTLTRFTTGGSTTLATHQTHGRSSMNWGTGLVDIDVQIDPDKQKAVITWPDKSTSVISSVYFSSETSNYAIWELFENNGSTDVSASLGALWASSDPAVPDAAFRTAIDTTASTAVVPYNVTGALSCDFTRCLWHEVSMVGNVTSLTFTNPPSRHDLYTVEFVQDATGSRTLTGVSSNIKFAGGTTPTLTTTASRRDIFRFRFNGTNYNEVSRSMNVG